MIHKFFYYALLGLFLFFLAACRDEKAIHLHGKTMGTTYKVTYIENKTVSIKSRQVQLALEEILATVNAQMSTYLPDSELSKFNKSVANIPISVSSDVITVINEALRIHQFSDGAFDITLLPLVNLWGFGAEDRLPSKPTEEELAQRRSWIGVNKLMIDTQKNRLTKTIDQLEIDLSGIAKGFAVDLIAQYLLQQGIENYLVEIGGEVKTQGKNDRGEPWRIKIINPLPAAQLQLDKSITLPIDKAFCIATSGDYFNYFEYAGEYYSHTINPNTGYPIKRDIISISILNESCMTADGLSTALNVLGTKKSLALAKAFDIPLFIIAINEKGVFTTHQSAAFAHYLNKK